MLYVIILIIVIFIIYHSYHKSIEEKKEIHEFNKKNEPKYNKEPYMNNGYFSPPPVTGDHYKWKCVGESHGYKSTFYSVYSGCEYEGSSVCANCTRRKETLINGKKYYGASEACYSHYYVDE